MKTIFFLIVMMTFSAFADDADVTKVTIVGTNGDSIAAIASLTTGTTGNSVFATGNVPITCYKSIHPSEVVETSVEENYTCIVGHSVKIRGNDAEQMAKLSFLYSSLNGDRVSVSGAIKVSCHLSTPVGQDEEVLQHYSCLLKEAR